MAVRSDRSASTALRTCGMSTVYHSAAAGVPLKRRLDRYVPWIVLALIAAYGGLLRFDAISAKFDAVAAPAWLHRFESWRAGPSALRPEAMRWEPYPRYEHKDGPPSQYRSDPYTYLQYAREMRSFYAAHYREPIFPFATKIWLWLVRG